MNYGTFESSQYVDVRSWKGDGKEAEFQLTLNCTASGCAAQIWGPPENCYPAEAAEFELESVHVLDDEGKPVKISAEILEAVVGKEAFQQMISDAEIEAMESGDF